MLWGKMIGIKFFAVIGALCLVVIIVLSKKLINWKKRTEKKNIRLMQLYLELKFLYKNLADSATITSSAVFCQTLISSIKEYYNLEEVIIIDSVKMNLQTNSMNVLKKMTCNFLQKHEKEISQKIKNKQYLTKYIEISKKKYLLYIFELASNVGCDGFIVCVENYPTLLSKNELLGLENNINLLKTRLASDD